MEIRSQFSHSHNPAYIVAVEDNPADIELLRVALDQCGQDYRLQVLRDGHEALRFVEEQRSASIKPLLPCVIVLDLYLPLHSGMAVLAALKETPGLDHIRVVVFTGSASPEQQQQAAELGARLFLEKPIDLDNFIAAAQQILDVCNERSAAEAA